jgi:vitamin B12 transporter
MRPVYAFAPLRGVVVAFAVLVTLLSGSIAPARAQGTIELPAIDVVSATLIPTPASQTASSVTVITAADIEREQQRTVPDALRTVPGLNVLQTGGPGGQTSVFMRGTNSNHVKVFIDGIDAGDPSSPNGAFDFAHLLTGDIERIEVLRGPQSGLYGSDAIGGVISITTKRGEGPPRVTALVEGGSFGTFNQNAGVSGSQGNFDYAFNFLHYRATNIPVTPLNLLAPGVPRNNDSYNNWTYSANLGAKVTDDLSVRVIGRYTQAKYGFTGDDFVNFAPPAPEALQETQVNHNTFTRAEAVWVPLDGFKNVFGVSYTSLWNRTVNPNADGFFTPIGPPTTNLGQRTKFDWHGEAKVAPGQVVVLGLEHQKETMRTDSTGVLDPFFNFTQTTTTAKTGNNAGFVELQSEYAKRFFLVSNIRRDDNETFGGHTTWRLAPAVLIPETDTKLKASYGTGFKAPTLTELFVNNPSFGVVANPNLRPEISKGYDAGFEQSLLNKRFSFGVTYFNNEIKDLIVGTFDPVTFISSYTNVGLAKTHGVESFAAFIFNEQFRVRGDYTTTVTRNAVTDLGLLRRPGNKESLTAIWTPISAFTLSTTVLHSSSWVDIGREGTPPRLNAPAYTTVNLAANYDVDKHLTVFARADNLFNHQYETPIGFLRPGLGVYGGVRVTN